MTLLFAVVGITSRSVFSKMSEHQSINSKCALPYKYAFQESYDLPFVQYKNEREKITLAYVNVLNSFFRNMLIKNKLIDEDEYVELLSDDPMLQINITKEILSHKPYEAFRNLLKNTENPHVINQKNMRISFNLNDFKDFYDIDAIKDYIEDYSIPVTIMLPGFKKLIDDNGIIRSNDYDFNETEFFVIYGWNDEFIPKKKMFSNENDKDYVGGFIAKQFKSLEIGHTIPYLYGNLGYYQEKNLCPNPNSLSSFPFIKYNSSNLSSKSVLSCNNNNICDTDVDYYLLSNTDDDEEKPMIRISDNEYIVSLVSKNNLTEIIELKFDSIANFTSSFRIKNYKTNGNCGFIFIPYDIITDLYKSYQFEIGALGFNIEFFNKQEFSIIYKTSKIEKRPGNPR